VHSKTASTSPNIEPVIDFVSCTRPATSFAKASFSSIVLHFFIGTTIPASANLFFKAKSTLSDWMSAMITLPASEALHIAAHKSPTAPAPKTRTVLPFLIDARRVPCIATLSGSRIAPSSRETLPGNLLKCKFLPSTRDA
jgi:hypothetical protein